MNGKQILQLLAIGVVLVLLAWIAFYLLIFAMIVGVAVAVMVHLRRFLIAKGIITPKASPNAAPGDDGSVTTIEIVEYHEVTPADPERPAP